MFKTSVKFSGALLLAAALASCETAGMFPQPGQAYIKEVSVTASPSRSPAPPGAETRLQATVVNEASRFPQTGAPKRVAIVIESYHLKNPALSLLIGDQNHMGGTMLVSDVGSTAPPKAVPLYVQDAYQVQGVIGAVQAAAQDRSLVESRLVSAASSSVLEKFYGTKLLGAYVRTARSAAPVPGPAAIQPEPAAQPQPAKPHAGKPRHSKPKPAAAN
ncbi:hypothetical protein J8I29_21070 [Labrys sp. LIt4]|uniref:hypothetical protein n=1 Tax=Labrys sp. LIt4 TaxID=2821355 RepID=UPI001ADED87B|nr:hypothetical protein [Labrys sp. LIt4]MBP0581834.1 hypothetical protein [Labrys sp. LIt4]